MRKETREQQGKAVSRVCGVRVVEVVVVVAVVVAVVEEELRHTDD